MSEDGAWVLDPGTQLEVWVPAGLEPSAAIHRAEEVREGRLISLRLLPEHGVRYPVWQVGFGLLAEDTLPLSSALNAKLREWMQLWESNVDSSGTWSSATARDVWIAQKSVLEDALERELWDAAVVVRN